MQHSGVNLKRGMISLEILDLPQIRRCVEASTALRVIAEGLLALERGEVQLGAVGHLAFPSRGGDCHIKSAARTGGRWYVVKVASCFDPDASTGQSTHSGLMLLMDAATGRPVCLLKDGGWLTDLRTALVAVHAARLLKPPAGTTLGILGTGVQAQLQAQWVSQHAGFAHIVVWGRNPCRLERMAAVLREQGAQVTLAATAAEVAERSDVIITATSAREPLLVAEMLDRAARIIAVGADAKGKQEVCPKLTASMAHLIVDCPRQCLDHGEIAVAHAQQRLAPSRITTLGAHLTGRLPALTPSESALVDLTGLGIHDLQMASMVWECHIRQQDDADQQGAFHVGR